MAIRKKTSTTRLPQALREELGETASNDHPHARHRSHHQLSRKEARKEQRSTQKQKKAAFFSQNPKKRFAEDEHAESPQRKKTRHEEVPAGKPILRPSVAVNPSNPPKLPKAEISSRGSTVSAMPKSAKTSTKPTVLEKLVRGSSSRLPPSRSQKEEEDDTYIAYLESKLGYSKGDKKKKKSEADEDGLDDLMEWADAFDTSIDHDAGKGEGFEEGLRLEDWEYDLEEEEDEGEEEEDDEEDNDEEWGGLEEEDEESGVKMDEEEDEAPQLLDTAQPAPVSKPTPGTAYVPPHLRNLQEGHKSSEEIQKLKRQLKGLLNRMSEQNMDTILDSMEEIYRNHRRNDVTTTVTNLIIDGVSAHSLLLDSYVVLHAAFISSLHKIIGIEFAAHFVQNVVASYERHYAVLKSSDAGETGSSNQDDSKGKECSNLIVLLSELYNFQVISSILIFDVIRGLLGDEHLAEFNVELLLKVVRNSGPQLRQDDPSALKDIIQIVQSRVPDNKDDILSSRTRFMIETLTNLKNNKLKRNITQNQGGAAVERMKKFLSSLGKKKHILAHEPLRVSLEDLHSAETKGKWWLVGAAWGGDPLIDRQGSTAMTPAITQPEPVNPANELLKLAKKQGMNTDIRRSIFVVLMSSDDYVDACERLSQLNLSEVQQRDIVRVLLHCCGNEKSYNPYYTLVCQQLCRASHGHKITLQFCLWDFLRDLGETTVGGTEVIKNMKDDESFDVKNISKSRLRNVARAYAWWIAKGCVTLAILKPVDFTILKPQTQEFLKEMMTQLFISSQVATTFLSMNVKDITRNHSTVEEIFIKASRIQSLAMGLVYFLSETFKRVSYEDEGMTKFIKWAVDLAKDTLQAGVDVIPPP
ncbi:hypothetical protein BDQ12DRAFT_691462 [Crucibulum laeve]|uniref:MI domain-containing protein n=1 Tax=Crucibulum laeve TaxID=68775 RepID=A0A5C3LLU7_9AGAR|nr:hypothetical protein BDQ12DRAFT_691462 [Crucibulum laeve]